MACINQDDDAPDGVLHARLINILSHGNYGKQLLPQLAQALTREFGKGFDATSQRNGSKRHLLVDGRGVPLSIIVTGANRHDVSQVEAVLAAIMVKRPSPAKRRHKHLRADAGDTGAPALRLIEAHGYIPHVKGRGQEAGELKRDPAKKARRWIVEVAHSGCNRCRKLLVRYEKLDRSFLGLNHLAAAIIAYRKVPLTVNSICG